VGGNVADKVDRVAEQAMPGDFRRDVSPPGVLAAQIH
jgi:hypothetical protein